MSLAPVSSDDTFGRRRGDLTDFWVHFAQDWARLHQAGERPDIAPGPASTVEESTMSRRTLWVPWLCILAATAATSAEFLVDARVDVVPALTIQMGEFPLDLAGSLTLRVDESQDRCLQWHLNEPEPSDRSSHQVPQVQTTGGTVFQSWVDATSAIPVVTIDLN